jgi:hypothetical protein
MVHMTGSMDHACEHVSSEDMFPTEFVASSFSLTDWLLPANANSLTNSRTFSRTHSLTHLRVTREVGLWNDSHTPVCGVGHDVTHVRHRVRPREDPRQTLREIGELCRVECVAAVVTQVQVKHVHLERCHGVKECHDRLDRPESTTSIDHERTMFKARSVCYVDN